MTELNASDRKSIRAAEKSARQIEVARGEVVRGIMSSATGREYIWSKLESAHMFATSYSPDALAMAFAEGERNQGIQLLNDIMQWCPDQFILAMREHHERHISRSRSATGQRPSSEDGLGDVEGSDDIDDANGYGSQRPSEDGDRPSSQN